METSMTLDPASDLHTTHDLLTSINSNTSSALDTVHEGYEALPPLMSSGGSFFVPVGDSPASQGSRGPAHGRSPRKHARMAVEACRGDGLVRPPPVLSRYRLCVLGSSISSV